MLFVATCLDKSDGADKRMENRPAHLAYLNSLGKRVKIGGALHAPDHKTPVGSMIVFEAESQAEVLAHLAKDPFSLAGVFESVSVNPWRQGVGQSLA
jgi:uncharacterized protein